jgi:hypothetical protein
MANTIDIAVRAIDKTGDIFNDILSSLGLSNETIEKISTKIPGIVAGFTLAGTAANAIYDYTKQAVAETITYGEEIENIKLLTGQTADEASRLYQAAQGAGVEYKDLSTALETATKKGVDTSIESILSLMDQYGELSTPIEKAKFLTDNFGAAGTEMGVLFEGGRDAIVSAMADVNNALVLDEEALQSINDFEKANKKLQDSFDSLKMKVGLEVIPTLLSFLDVLNDEGGIRTTGFERMFGGTEEEVDSTNTAVGNLNMSLEELTATYDSNKNGVIELAEMTEEYKKELAAIVAYQNSLHDKTVTYTIRIREVGGSTSTSADQAHNAYIGLTESNRAIGGYTNAGTSYLVGERGPEIFTPSGGGQITPNNQIGSGGMSQSDMTQFAKLLGVVVANEIQKVMG